MPDWSIKIIPNPSAIAGQPALFVPDLKGAKPGDPLLAQPDDIITWNNTTGDAHWPWPTDSSFKPLPDSQVSGANGNYLSNQIPAGKSSRPSYDVVFPTGVTTLYYCCKLHPEMHGTIVLTNPYATTS